MGATERDVASEPAKAPAVARPRLSSDLLICPACQSNNLADSKYCHQCGIKLWHDNVSDPPLSRRSVSIDPHSPTDPPAHADPLIGVVVAERYRIVEPIGRGGMGVVYKVEHARIGKLMALKLLTGELGRDATLVARFKREALLASRLSHPNTVQVFDFGAAAGLTYLAMEYLRGEDLGRLIRRHGWLPPMRTAKIMLQICSSLAEAHDKGIVHRDLKPENIMILRGQSREDVVKVLDFGLAKLRESAALNEVTSRGAIVGTPYYMSPEQVRGDPVEPRTDVYSLGALTYACLTGRPVFEAPTPIGAMTRHLTDNPQNPSQRFPELCIPRSMSAVVLKALAKDPADRYQSVRELQLALIDELRGQGQTDAEEFLDTQQVRRLTGADEDAATRDEVERYERKLRRRGRTVWASFGATMCLAGAVGWQAFVAATRPAAFSGAEAEPNDTARQAQALPFGAEIRGQVGRRLDRQRSDRDLYHIDVPAGVRSVRIESTALPNMATCSLLYRAGTEDPIGRFCSGAAGRDLIVPAWAIAQGSYLIAVMQDQDRYGVAPAPPVFENVSDYYRLRMTSVETSDGEELEPNDDLSGATLVPVGATLRGRLAWMRDVDVICAKAKSGSVSFVVDDALGSVRPRHAVLEVTPEGGAQHRIPVRVRKGSALSSPYEARGPWTSPAVELGPTTTRACLTLRLVPDPFAETPHPYIAPASQDEYSVLVQAGSPASAAEAAAKTVGKNARARSRAHSSSTPVRAPKPVGPTELAGVD